MYTYAYVLMYLRVHTSVENNIMSTKKIDILLVLRFALYTVISIVWLCNLLAVIRQYIHNMKIIRLIIRQSSCLTVNGPPTKDQAMAIFSYHRVPNSRLDYYCKNQLFLKRSQ